MNKEQTEALERIESIRAELEQLERVVATPAWEPQPGDVVEVGNSSVRIFSHMQGSKYACLLRTNEWSHIDAVYYSECRPATPVVVPKHVEPELCYNVWCGTANMSKTCCTVDNHVKTELLDKTNCNEYDLIKCVSRAGGVFIYLGHWNDGPRE